MRNRPDAALMADPFLDADEADAPIDEWTLDDLDRSADLSSLRSAWANAYDPNE
jgi:hypothetical protein